MAQTKENKQNTPNYPYAVVQAGAKQFRVSEGDHILVEKLEVDPGKSWETEDVLLIAKGPGDVSIGQPKVSGAKVSFEVLQQTLGDKILIRHHSRRHNSQFTKGHRQPYTRLAVTKIKA